MINLGETFSSTIEFLDHVFDTNKVNLLDSRAKGINYFPEPTSVKGVKNLGGMTNFFRDFLSDYLVT